MRQVAVAVIITFSWDQLVWAAPDTLSAPAAISAKERDPAPGAQLVLGDVNARYPIGPFLDRMERQTHYVSFASDSPEKIHINPRVRVEEIIDLFFRLPPAEDNNNQKVLLEWLLSEFETIPAGANLAKLLVEKSVKMWRQEKRILPSRAEVALTEENRIKLEKLIVTLYQFYSRLVSYHVPVDVPSGLTETANQINPLVVPVAVTENLAPRTQGVEGAPEENQTEEDQFPIIPTVSSSRVKSHETPGVIRWFQRAWMWFLRVAWVFAGIIGMKSFDALAHTFVSSPNPSSVTTKGVDLFAIPEVWTEVTRQNNTLWGIAKETLTAFHMNPADSQIDAVVKMIVSDNHITNPDIIHVGQRIHIPVQQVMEQFHLGSDLLSQAFQTLTGTPLPQVSQVTAQVATAVSETVPTTGIGQPVATDGIFTQIMDWVSSHSLEIGVGILVVGLVAFLGWSLYQDFFKGKKGKGPFLRIQPAFNMPPLATDRKPVETLPVPVGTEFSNRLINLSESGLKQDALGYLEKKLPQLDVPDCLVVVEHLLMAFNKSRNPFLLELAERVAREAVEYAYKEEFPVALAYSGLVRHAKGDVKSAIQLYEGVVALLPESEQAMERVLRYAKRDRAIPVFDHIISLATTRRPGTQLRLGDIEEAISGAGEMLEDDPETADRVIRFLMEALTKDPLRTQKIQRGVVRAIGLCLSQEESPEIIAAAVISLREVLEEADGASQEFTAALKRLLVTGEVRLAQQPLMGQEISGEMEALPRLMRGIRPHLNSESALLSAI